MTYAIIVHGGAGAWKDEAEKTTSAVEACEQAAAAGQRVLQEGGRALDAVEAAVRVLEDCPILNAARGSHLNALGEVEMDALIMDGATLELGAVAAIQRVRHPISLARRVLKESEHNFLVGAGAERFAEEIGFPRCDPAELLVGEELAEFEAIRENPNYRTSHSFGDEERMDTVGAVALDSGGNLAAATSTGGTRKKYPGRVGDSPLVGSGAYADNWTAASSATGYGEALMRVVISLRVSEFVSAGLSAGAACRAAIEVLHERVGGRGGLIAIDARGRVGHAFNTAAMPHAWAVEDGVIKSGR
ncbi:MAG: isoaspartyl peptidase/L-asparaginase [Candidatus Promineifilaceae bacterium]|nr:isoaspartyl peptidase/L-asparaginase [Candidatus Promineifilaceae bacterium]